MVKLKRYLLGVIMLVFLAAGYSQKSEAAPCPIGGSYQDLISAGSCDIGDKTFSAFTLGWPGHTASEVGFASIEGPPEWGFLFAGFTLLATAGTSDDITIGYIVTCNALAPVFDCITSDHLTQLGVAVNGGRAFVDESNCLNAAAGCANPIVLHPVQQEGSGVSAEDFIAFPGADSES